MDKRTHAVTTWSCGDMQPSLSPLLKRDAQGGLFQLFASKSVSYCYNTRVAIRKLCEQLSLKPGDEILGPAYNCGSELDPFRQAGATVVLYDINPDSSLNVEAIASLMTRKTKAVYFTHYFGFAQTNTAALRELCNKSGIAMIEDCALSLLSGATGTTGDAALFCFYKFFPVLGGGALVLNTSRLGSQPQFDGPYPQKAEIKSLVRSAANSFLGKSLNENLRRKRSIKAAAPDLSGDFPDMPATYYFDPKLENARISPLTLRAAQAFDIKQAITSRRSNFVTYLESLKKIVGIRPLFETLPEGVCPLNMPVLINNRNAVAASLSRQGIAAVPWWAGYNRHFEYSGFPNARNLKDNILALPLHQGLDERHIDLIVNSLKH